MTMLLPKPLLKQTSASVVRHVPRPIPIQQSDNFPNNRLELKPLLGTTVFLDGVIQRHSFRHGRSFVCLEDVSYGQMSQRFLPVNERELQTLHHSWMETTTHGLLPPAGDPCVCVCEVIAYKRRDTSFSYGFKTLSCIAGIHVLGFASSRCREQYECGDYPGSVSALFQRTFDDVIEDYRSGICRHTELPILFNDQGSRYYVSIVQKIRKRMQKYLTRGRIEDALDYLDRITAKEQAYLDTYIENEV